ncbi:MAG TPA: DUF4337 domain-containing protein [Hyphomicrobium sp.]|nr:DUF4337 domain-containing protein [Hyphomicrobium sp.]
MAWDQLGSDADALNSKRRDKLIGVYIGLLAVVLAICGMGGGNAAKESTLRNIEASNTWGFFQSKNIRRAGIRLQVDEMTLLLETNPSMPEAAAKHIQAKIDEYRALDTKLTSDKQSNEGLDELFSKGKAQEAARDIALQRDPYFDYGQALLQIAIVLASVAIISGGNMLLLASACVGALGVIATVGGFTLAFPLPFAG